MKPYPICGTSRVSYERTLNNIEVLKCSASDFVYANLKDQDINTENSQFDEDAIAGYEVQQTFIYKSNYDEKSNCHRLWCC